MIIILSTVTTEPCSILYKTLRILPYACSVFSVCSTAQNFLGVESGSLMKDLVHCVVNDDHFLNERKGEKSTLTWAHLKFCLPFKSECFNLKSVFIKVVILRGGGGSIKVGVYRQKGHKLGRAIWDLESWVQYSSNEIFPSNF